MFKELNSVPNFPDLEKKQIEYWARLNVVEALKNDRISTQAPERVYYDGPITANGVPHYGHAITWTLKDIIPRYWSMLGYLVYKNMGWDCQGIPVEYEVEKELKFERKEDIEVYGVEKFNQLCRDSVLKHQAVMKNYETRLGRWFDETQIYSTMDPKYIESIWWSLKELYNKGLLYEGYKVVAYSTRAGTTLSTHEVSEGGYKDIEDPWITVKFRLLDISKFADAMKSDETPIYFLAWTTTPWTIPGNLMLSVGKNIKYVLVESEGEGFILAEERLEPVFGNRIYSKKSDLTYEDLIGLEYEQPFPHFEAKRAEGCFRVLEAGHTNTEEGTGLVHLAPYGAEDFDVFMSKGIMIFDYLDETANFTSLVPEYQGLFYKKANSKIIEDLTSIGRLFSNGTLVHRMPMCWRTSTPLIYKPVKSWYVAVTKIKDKMKELNQQINWLPEHLKDGNSGIWINNARDWALSRSRYWGTPLPVWVNDKTGEKVMVGSFEELKELSGLELSDPHKPFVDEVTWEDKTNGGTFKRVKDVIDVWYDSGAMPFAQFHYPFENKDRFKVSFPAEYISEGPDQVRLWFYVMHVLGVALFDKVPYKNVVTIGTMLDEHGKKLSKSKKNYKPMDEVLDVYGGDVLRYFILTSSIVSGSDAIFSEKFLSESRKEFFLILWNSIKYFVTYANLYNFKPSSGEPDLQELDESNPQYDSYLLDKWILSRLKKLEISVRDNLDKYLIMDAAREFQPFVSDLSTWYIRRSRDRLKDGDSNALKTLYFVLVQLAKHLAPFLPFISEEMYQILNVSEVTGKKSVHLDLLSSKPTLTTFESELLERMEFTRQVVSLALSLRVSEGVKVRQPLSELYIESKLTPPIRLIDNLVLDEVNLKKIILGSPSGSDDYKSVEDTRVVVHMNMTITPDLKIEGEARELVRKIQEKRKEMELSVNHRVKVEIPRNAENEKIVEKFNDYLCAKVLADTIILVEGLRESKVTKL